MEFTLQLSRLATGKIINKTYQRVTRAMEGAGMLGRECWSWWREWMSVERWYVCWL